MLPTLTLLAKSPTVFSSTSAMRCRGNGICQCQSAIGSTWSKLATSLATVAGCYWLVLPQPEFLLFIPLTGLMTNSSTFPGMKICAARPFCSCLASQQLSAAKAALPIMRKCSVWLNLLKSSELQVLSLVLCNKFLSKLLAPMSFLQDQACGQAQSLLHQVLA